MEWLVNISLGAAFPVGKKKEWLKRNIFFKFYFFISLSI